MNLKPGDTAIYEDELVTIDSTAATFAAVVFADDTVDLVPIEDLKVAA